MRISHVPIQPLPPPPPLTFLGFFSKAMNVDMVDHYEYTNCYRYHLQIVFLFIVFLLPTPSEHAGNEFCIFVIIDLRSIGV